MNILLLGATGRVGGEILKLALLDGHQVTALVRTPEKLIFTHRNLKIVQGNVRNSQHVEAAMDTCETVISALNTDNSDTLSQAMPVIIEAIQKAGITRIITVGTAGILQSRTNPAFLRYQIRDASRKYTTAAEDHHKAYLQLSQTDLDWTIVCPTYLPDGERVGQYRIERDFLPVNGKQISTADTADFTYQQLKNHEFIRSRVGIAY